jgi:hypothetical protein
MGTGGPFLVAKARPGRDAHYSPLLVPRSMSRSYTPLPPSAFMACSGTALALFIFVERVKVFYYIIHILFAWNRSSWSGGSPASNAGGPGLKSWPGHRLSWLKFFLGFTQALQAVAVIVPEATFAFSQILSNSSSTYHSFIRRHIVFFWLKKR